MKRANNINYNYFKKIDSEYKAYILGLIYADGSIIKSQGNRQTRLVISIQQEDSYVLQKLVKKVNNKEVQLRNPPSSTKNGWKSQGRICICSDEICNDLSNLGCIPNKTKLGMKFPELRADLIQHFIRGYFDGDGCINIKKRTYKGKHSHSNYFSKRICFVSTDKHFLETLCSHLPISKLYKREKLRTLLVHSFWIERQEDVKNVYQYLYKDANYYFTRKFDKFNTPIKSQAVDTSTEGLTTT